MRPAFGGFYQSAYVTNDLERALEVFRQTYGAPSFLTLASRQEVLHRGQPDVLDVRLALCNLNGVQLEVIEPQPGCASLYREVLPPDGGFAIVHHHMAVRINGDFERWKAWRAEAESWDRPIALEGDLGAAAQFIYLDDRARLGHYTEYLWTTGWDAMNARIPTYMETT